MSSAYINAIGIFLPGDPVDNDLAIKILGPIDRKQNLLRRAALVKNGIRMRHYALDTDGNHKFTNSRMAAHAVENALRGSEIGGKSIELLCAATSQGDLMAPGFASTVHGELQLPATEIASFTSFCASGIMALKSAVSAIGAGEKRNAIVCASEFASRFLRAGYLNGADPSPDTEFLRWTLSDGAGAVILEDQPNTHGQSIKVDFIDLVSYADSFETCMYGGGSRGSSGSIAMPWSHYPSLQEAVHAGAFHLKQDFELLENITALGLKRYLELVESGKIDPFSIDWALYHFSSHHFREEMGRAARRAGVSINQDKIFTNLYEKGNTGSASIYVMLEELFNGGRLQDGEKILIMVPESGRFIISFIQMTVIGAAIPLKQTVPSVETIEKSKTAYDEPIQSKEDLRASLVRRLTTVWLEFERQMHLVPVIERLNRGKLRQEDYQSLLRNLRQQVAEGARWIARAASNITADSFEMRSSFLRHAYEEHQDFLMLEDNYVSVGGRREDIVNAEKNIGSEALSAWMFHKSSCENPVDLFGAMFIIEGLGHRLAAKWGKAIQNQLDLDPDQVSFLLYHGENDDHHIDRMWDTLGSLDLTQRIVDDIVKAAKVTARLYRLQLEELDNT